MLAEPRPDTSIAEDTAPLKLVVDRQLTPARPARRDWSNVVFSVAFCEEARRDFERRNLS
ncbi:hypothetical protein G5B40_04905 [Pikeienuella piscinae]|uniref:Uncharacterized protein n=1 Tax=Pikeienuella piscinae TaxID=2748098 RepID=A0A7L5BTP2_9RHOB|nr:hypothetical protein [Pikeienuella piscinae]QIE54842.1 hypothetical protein G5B40_04905 [Pikeienuella piscinae]